MRTVKLDLERKRQALSSAIKSSMGSARQSDHGREVLKDPYGSARLTHDDEVTAAVAPARLRVLPFATRCVACQANLEGSRRAA